MPELPEVARMALSLNQNISGKILSDIRIHSGRYMRHGAPKGFEEFIQKLPMKVREIRFHGKLLVFIFEDQSGGFHYISNTLGMSGGWRPDHSKHGHVELVTNEGSVFFTDPRNFGTIKFISSEEYRRKAASIGPDHLNNDIPDETFKDRLSKKSDVTIPEALMNQGLIGGIGNYIKSEVMYRARISPNRLVKSLSDEEFSALNRETREVVGSSFRSGGATILTYSTFEGDKGEFPFFFHVYGREKCINGFDVQRFVSNEGRMTHWVPELQK